MTCLGGARVLDAGLGGRGQVGMRVVEGRWAWNGLIAGGSGGLNWPFS